MSKNKDSKFLKTKPTIPMPPKSQNSSLITENNIQKMPNFSPATT
jgi:hypothetical protein